MGPVLYRASCLTNVFDFSHFTIYLVFFKQAHFKLGVSYNPLLLGLLDATPKEIVLNSLHLKLLLGGGLGL